MSTLSERFGSNGIACIKIFFKAFKPEKMAKMQSLTIRHWKCADDNEFLSTTVEGSKDLVDAFQNYTMSY